MLKTRNKNLKEGRATETSIQKCIAEYKTFHKTKQYKVILTLFTYVYYVQIANFRI